MASTGCEIADVFVGRQSRPDPILGLLREARATRPESPQARTRTAPITNGRSPSLSFQDASGSTRHRPFRSWMIAYIQQLYIAVMVPEVEAVTDAVLTASRALVGVAARSLAVVDADVTLPQYRALVVLAARGSKLVGALAEELAIHPSTATRLCDRLVAKKLVRRAISRDNRRETEISLSPKGRAVVERVSDVRRREIATIVERVPPKLWEPTVRALNAFAEAAGELPQQAWTLGWS